MLEIMLSPKTALLLSKIKRRIFRHVWLVRMFVVVLVLSSLLALGIILNVALSKTLFGRGLGVLWNFVLAPTSSVQQSGKRTNVLLLGKSGGNYQAADLTDSIILISVSLEEPGIEMISLPRDIWIPAIRAKLNSAYYWGNQQKPGGGLILARSTVEEIVGVPVHYALVIDFSGFTRVIDTLGGISVEVEKGFVDEKYPIAGREDDQCGGDPEYKCRYQTVSFEEGVQRMDGETALKFVRSRNARGDEGTDLARAARQQRVISALKEEIFSSRTLLSPGKISKLVLALQSSIETDISANQVAVLLRKVFGGRGNVSSVVLPQDFLVNPPISSRYDFQYVFVPKAGNWSEVQNYVKNLLKI